MTMDSLDPQAIRAGNRLALARALTAVENNTPESREIQAALFPHTGHAHLIGVTGAPGSGKSTLVNQLAKAFRHPQGNANAPRVAIIAVDPTSPFTGGALLGDRIRMQDLAGDKGIFIRSMASRGALGGLAHNTAAFATVLDGAGFDVIIIETVGAGQAEVNIATLAHTVIVVEAPGMGDDIQAIKAGILEIADIIVVNKADRPGAENTARALQAMLEMARGDTSNFAQAGKHMRRAQHDQKEAFEPIGEQALWNTPIQLATAVDGKGVEDIVGHILHHKAFLQETGLWQVKEGQRLRKDLESLIQDLLIRRWQEALDDGKFSSILQDVIEKKRTPLDAAEALIRT